MDFLVGATATLEAVSHNSFPTLVTLATRSMMAEASTATTQIDYLHSPGYRCNLTPTQTWCLLELWRRFLQLCEISNHSSDSLDASVHRPPAHSSSSRRHSTSESGATWQAGSRRQHGRMSSIQDPPTTASVPKDDRLKEHLRHVEENKEMQEFLLQYGGAALRTEFWAIVKGEHPDAYMLRCLRARKWDVDRALAVIGSTCSFRVQFNVSGLLKEAELGLTKTRGGFNIMNNGISYTRGSTANGEPIYFIEVGAHYSSNQTAEELKRAVILLQESLQLLMPPPVERKVVIFNLNQFGLRNMDWSVVLFMAKTMESFYPETLARVYVHGAPWIFKPIWSILRPLLDPVVRDKVHLTWKVDELAEYVPADHLPQGTMHGNLDWSFQYPIPQENENDIQTDPAHKATFQQVELSYRDACVEFEYATRALARAYGNASLSRQGTTDDDGDDWEPEGLASLRASRDVLAIKVRLAWLKLKPYVVGKLKYDRWGVTDREGVIRWDYPTVGGDGSKVEVQVLGEGTSLSALERNLAELNTVHTAVASTPKSRPTKTKPPSPIPATDAPKEADKGGLAPITTRDTHDNVAVYQEVLPIHPSEQKRLLDNARNGDTETQP